MGLPSIDNEIASLEIRILFHSHRGIHIGDCGADTFEILAADAKREGLMALNALECYGGKRGDQVRIHREFPLYDLARDLQRHSDRMFLHLLHEILMLSRKLGDAVLIPLDDGFHHLLAHLFADPFALLISLLECLLLDLHRAIVWTHSFQRTRTGGADRNLGAAAAIAANNPRRHTR